MTESLKQKLKARNKKKKREHFILALRKAPEEVTQLIQGCKMLGSCPWTTAYQHTKGLPVL